MGAPSPERRAELMALLQKNPDRNPETGAPSGSTPAAPTTTSSVSTGKSNSPVADNRAAAQFGAGKVPSVNAPAPAESSKAKDFIDAVNAALPDMTHGGPIDVSRSPITGLPTPKVGESPAKPFLDAANQPLPDMTHGGPIDVSRSPITGLPTPKAGESPAKPFLDAANQPLPDMTHGGPIDVSRSPITGLPTPKVGESPAKPFLDAANQPLPDMTKGGPIDVSRSPITGLPTPKVGEAPKPVDMEAAKALFQHTHGSFDAKSKVDQAKMKGIMELMNKPEAAFMSPNQFAMQIYKNQKSRK
jgi:hypothetical protein